MSTGGAERGGANGGGGVHGISKVSNSAAPSSFCTAEVEQNSRRSQSARVARRIKRRCASPTGCSPSSGQKRQSTTPLNATLTQRRRRRNATTSTTTRTMPTTGPQSTTVHRWTAS